MTGRHGDPTSPTNRPPGPFRGAFQLHNSPPGHGRQRRVLAQCSSCHAIADAQIRSDRITWTGIPHQRIEGGVLMHRKCGGRIVAFDPGGDR